MRMGFFYVVQIGGGLRLLHLNAKGCLCFLRYRRGTEYDNIIFVISKGWNQYQFETYAPMINGSVPIPRGKEASFERNRNLFYVCCSRPKKRLVFFVSVPMTTAFHSYLRDLVGEENILTYGEYLGYA